MKKTAVFMAGAVLFMAACGHSPPTRFYTLAPMDQAMQPQSDRIKPLAIGDVNLPRILDRAQLVRRSGPSQLDIAGFDRWAAPLDELTRQTLTIDLQRQLPPNTILPPDIQANDSAGVLNVNIDKFESDEAGHVVLDASWDVTSGNPATARVRGNEHITADAADFSAPAMAGAMSRALGDLSQRIAARLPRG